MNPNMPYYYGTFNNNYSNTQPMYTQPYTPNFMQQNNMVQNNNDQFLNGGLAYVRTIEEAQKFVVQPNYCVFLMNTTQPILYKKWVDSAGNPFMEAYSITPFDENKRTSSTENNNTINHEARLETIEKKIDGIINFLNSLTKQSSHEETPTNE